MRATILAIGLLVAAGTNSAGAASSVYSIPQPAIKAAGRAVLVPGSAHQPKPGQRQRSVFHLTKAAASPDKLNPGLDAVARAVNLFVASGLKREQLDLVMVLSADATDAVLVDTAYRARHGRDNPNLKVIGQLAGSGVEVFVCGQALHARGLDKDSVADPVSVSLSALTSIIELQQNGYAFVPL